MFGVVEGREHLRFPSKASQPIVQRRGTGNRRRQHLERDVAAKCGVVGTVHLAHAAAADQRDDAKVSRERVAGPPAVG